MYERDLYTKQWLLLLLPIKVLLHSQARASAGTCSLNSTYSWCPSLPPTRPDLPISLLSLNEMTEIGIRRICHQCTKRLPYLYPCMQVGYESRIFKHESLCGIGFKTPQHTEPNRKFTRLCPTYRLNGSVPLYETQISKL